MVLYYAQLLNRKISILCCFYILQLIKYNNVIMILNETKIAKFTKLLNLNEHLFNTEVLKLEHKKIVENKKYAFSVCFSSSALYFTIL